MTRTRSYCHRGGATPLLGATIPGHFAAIVERFPHREAVVSRHQHRRLTYAQLKEEVDRLARALLAAGFGKGDRIGVWSTDNIEWLLLQLATARMGAVLVNINPANRTRELAHALSRSEVQGVFSIPSFRTSDYVAMQVELLPELKTSRPASSVTRTSSQAKLATAAAIKHRGQSPPVFASRATGRPHSGQTSTAVFGGVDIGAGSKGHGAGERRSLAHAP